MGLFNFFKKKNTAAVQEAQSSTPELKLQGPAYIRSFLKKPNASLAGKFSIKSPGIQWTGQLVSAAGNDLFTLHYYGDLLNNETVIETEEAVQKIVAIDPNSKEEILLFDKILHGRDGFLDNAYGQQIVVRRNTNTQYISKSSSALFQIIISAFYNTSSREELLNMVGADGLVETGNGRFVSLQDAFDNSFDFLLVYAIDEQGNKFEVVAEELA